MSTVASTSDALAVRLVAASELPAASARAQTLLDRCGPPQLSYHPDWPEVLSQGLRHQPCFLEAGDGQQTSGYLPLCFVRTQLFGRFLVSMPYLNYGGPVTDQPSCARSLVDAAVALADRLDVRYLELRSEVPIQHPKLTPHPSPKVHMRLPLPSTPAALWDRLSPKVRNQVRKGQKCGLSVLWGGVDRLDDFYDVFSRNMRDLGTPVFGRSLFRAILERFGERSELCVVRAGSQPVAAALLLHGRGVTEVPSASTLRAANPLCANMLLYWHLLERAIERGHDCFDFGRSTPGSPVQRFKTQWGAQPSDAHWFVYLRSGQVGDMRPDSPRNQRLIQVWKRLPLRLTRWLGPPIVRGIP